MADSAASPNSQVRRARPTKRPASAVSTETEDKLARAARSAQRLAQLSGVSRDDSTLDLFPDDPTLATLEAMTIDVRQGTLTGFELPAEVRAAVGLVEGGEASSAGQEAKSARRVTRAAKAGETSSASVQASVLDEREEPTLRQGFASGVEAEVAAPQATVAEGHDAGTKAVNAGPAVASAAVSKSVSSTVATGQDVVAAGPDSGDASVAQGAGSRASSVLPPAPSMPSAMLRSVAAARASEAAAQAQGGGTAQRFATPFARTSTASREAAASDNTMVAGDAAAQGAASAGRAQASGAMHGATADKTSSAEAFAVDPSAMSAAAKGKLGAGAATTASSTTGASTTPASNSTTHSATAPASPASGTSPTRPYVNPPAAASAHTIPELDRARATAFADTVDALYGVIADQRRAATDHSRRVKWMLSIVVGALLVSVAIGIAQTMLLMRLTRDTTAQQQRIEQMMLNQQATLSTLLDTDSATVSVPAYAAPAPAAPAAAPRATEQQPVKHAAKPHHPHKTKPAASH